MHPNKFNTILENMWFLNCRTKYVLELNIGIGGQGVEGTNFELAGIYMNPAFFSRGWTPQIHASK